MYRHLFCHRLILDIARLCSFPGRTTPPKAGGGPRAGSCYPLGPTASAHPGRTQRDFPKLGVGGSEPSLSRRRQPAFRGSWKPCERRCPGVQRGGPGSAFPHKRGGSLHAGPGGCHAATPDLSQYEALKRQGPGSFRKEQDRARPTHDYVTLTLEQRFMMGTPRTGCQSTLSKKPPKSTHTYHPHPFSPT